jgi:tRNA dimethylallyltransferase
MSRVVAIFGPTASGKSAVALALAAMVGGEIVSCDAMQAYRGLPILTNQPSAADLAAVPHHLVGIWPLDHRGSVAEFGELARAAIDDVLGRGRTPIVAGGTGLYLRAALAEMRPPAQPAPGVRERYEELYDRRGARAAHGVLETLDAPAAAAVHPNDRRRVVRALELHEAGESLTGGMLWQPDVRRPTALFGLQLPAALGAARIAGRTWAMFDSGVVEEVGAATAQASLSQTALRIHGLQDVTALLEGRIDRDEAIRRLDTRTRRYAKRQRTWMRKLPSLVSLDASQSPTELAAEIASQL